MDYEVFSSKLNQKIFGDDLNKEILLTCFKNPERYIGLFRITNAKTKLIQNITQSCEIKFGDFLEDTLTDYIAEMGYENLDKNIGCDEDGNKLSADQFFRKDDKLYLIEQKVRDDHDSTKKRGQYSNLIKKIKCIKAKYPNIHLFASMWFSDPALHKNKKYYQEEISYSTDDMVDISLYYGNELFAKVFNRIDVWDELIMHLRKNKSERSVAILSVPDFDTSPEMRAALIDIKCENPNLIKRLLSNKEIYREIRAELFPLGKNLEGL